ncbi:VOC family protein [Arthrobacter sp. R1-13]
MSLRGFTIMRGGALMHWHVDDLEATVERLQSMGATEYQPITAHGEK